MSRVTDVAKAFDKSNELYKVWKGYDTSAKGIKLLIHNSISMIHDGAWMFSRLRSGYTVFDIGIMTIHKGRGLWYGAERFVISLWKYRNLWKWVYHI